MVIYSEERRRELYKKAYELLKKNYEICRDKTRSEYDRALAHINYSDLSYQLDAVDMSDDSDADFAYGALEASIKQAESGKPPRVF